ncbi:MAG TPA: hypothetical protein VIK75_09925 [Calditerricola sp.]
MTPGKWRTIVLALSLLLAGCGQSANTTAPAEQPKGETGQETQQGGAETTPQGETAVADAFKMALKELDKAKEGQPVDFERVATIYKESLQGLVQKRDAEFQENLDQQLTTALEAGKSGQMDPLVVRQVFDKLMQKVVYLTLKHEFQEALEKWGDKAHGKEEVAEAKAYYALLKGTVEKRDAAYGTQMAATIDGAFADLEKALASGDKLAFELAKQVVDKMLMKTFYLAAGALEHGYAGKAAKEAKKDPKKAKVEQAEGWAFYQSLYPYLAKYAKEEADFIQQQFDLSSDVTKLDPQAINKAFIRGYAKVALHEYEESAENWGQDEGVITALEGALFIDLLEGDLKRLLGEQAYGSLRSTAQHYLEAAKARDEAKGKALREELEKTLRAVVKKAQ